MYTFVFQRLANRAAVTATDDEDITRVVCTHERDMDKHVVVVELVLLSEHDNIVQQHDVAEERIPDDLDSLKQACLIEEYVVDPEA